MNSDIEYNDLMYDEGLEEFREEDIELEDPSFIPQVDITPIADASAKVLNGPNGAKALEVIETGLYIAGGLGSLYLVLKYAPGIITLFKKAAA